MTAAEFSKKSGMLASTINKLLSAHRKPIIKILRRAVAVTVTRPVIDYIPEKKLKVVGIPHPCSGGESLERRK
jgi:predicted transcriptional regulator